MTKISQITRLIALGAAITLSGCGGGGTDSTTPATTKKATLTFTAISTSTLPANINGIKISATLPSGATVTTKTGGVEIDDTQLTGGTTVKSALSTSYSVYGSYSSSVRKVSVSLLDTSSTLAGFRLGDFVVVTCTVPTATTEADFTALNSSFAGFKAYGYNTATHSQVDLTAKIKPTISVKFE